MTTKESSKSIKCKSARELFVGAAGCGKSEEILKLFEERLREENPLDPQSYFIVPSREHAERIIKILVTRGSHGFFSNRITTLDELIEGAFEIPNPPVASNLTKIAIVRRLLSEDCGVYFESIREKPGFLNLILNMISELKDHCWHSAQFRKEMERLKKLEPDSALKYEGLAGIYERYDASLAQLGLRDRKDTLSIYLEHKKNKNTKPLHYHTLCFDGFFDFTPLQRESMNELINVSKRAYATLTWDAKRSSVFEPVTATHTMFREIGFVVKAIEASTPRFLTPELSHISQTLFTKENQPARCSSTAIDWFEAPDSETEAEMVARRILLLLSEKKFRPSQIAILCRSVRTHRAIFETVLRRFKIPFVIHERERLSESEWVQTVARLVRVFREDWKKDDWLGFLRSSFVLRYGEMKKDERVLHAFEGWCWKNGLRQGYDHWSLALQAKGADADAGQVAANELFEYFSSLQEEFKKCKSAGEWSFYLKQMLYRDFGMLESLQSQDKNSSFQHEFHAPARFEKILQEMECATDHEKKEQLSFDKFADDFLRLVDLDLFSLPNLNQNAVQIYDVSLARQKEYEVVFVVGLAEKEFPQQIREEPLLSDWERRLIQGSQVRLFNLPSYCLPERKARQQLERYLFYLAVTRARQHLCLSHARRDLEGKPVLRSFYVEELTACFENKLKPSIKKDTQPYPAFDEVLTSYDLKLATIGAVFNPWEKEPEEVFLRELLDYAWNDARSSRVLARALKNDEAQLLDDKILSKKQFHLDAPSPTRLESFARCPFRYFSERILKLQVTEEDTRARNQGSIMHGVLEDFFQKTWKDLSEDALELRVKELLAVWSPKYPLDLGPYQTELAVYEMKTILLRFIRYERERLQKTPFQPRYFEYKIPKEKPVTLKHKSVSLKLQGMVDRVDVNEEEGSFIVSDYKRSKDFKKSELAEGVSLQLPLYLLALSQLLKLKPVGGQLLNMKDIKSPTGFFENSVQGPRNKMSEDEFQEALDRALRYSTHYLDQLAHGKISVEPRDCADNCSFTSLCRIEKWKLPEITEKIRTEDKKRKF